MIGDRRKCWRRQRLLNADAPTAAFFAERAHDLLRGVSSRRRAGIGSVEADLHSICCALELSLKAVLLHAGCTDEQNRDLIRHSLTRVVVAAEHLGFVVPDELKSIIERVSPYYERHRLRELESSMTVEVAGVVHRHLLAVRDRLA